MLSVSIRGKELFKDGCVDGYYNNVKMEMLDGSGLVITNDYIIGESLRMTERACSGDTLKFGVCEAKSLEIECFDIPNIKGKRFFLSVEKLNAKTGNIVDTVKYGEFLVDSCKKQPFDGRRKIVAYDDLRSTTLDKDMAEAVNINIENTEDFVQPCVFQIEKDLLQKFGINRKEKEKVEIKWGTGSTSINEHKDENGYYSVVCKTQHLSYVFEESEYYVFVIPDELQDKREKKVREIIRTYGMQFSGSNSWWIDQLCYIRISGDGKNKSFVGRNGDESEYTDIHNVNVFVLNEIIVKSASGQEVKTLTFGYDDAVEQIKILKLNLTTMEKVRMKEKVESVTLRNILASMYELKAEFGRMNRETGLLESVPLNNGALYPRDTLYPADTLYPGGGESAEKGVIENVWVDERGGVIYGKLKINYMKIGEDGNKEEAVYEYVFDEEHNRTYEVNDNWILQNIVMTDEEIAAVAIEMGQGMKGVEVTPFEAEMIGIPYLEAGDMIEIPDGGSRRRVYVLERTISGIQGMKDSIEALGGGV